MWLLFILRARNCSQRKESVAVKQLSICYSARDMIPMKPMKCTPTRWYATLSEPLCMLCEYPQIYSNFFFVHYLHKYWIMKYLILVHQLLIIELQPSFNFAVSEIQNANANFKKTKRILTYGFSFHKIKYKGNQIYFLLHLNLYENAQMELKMIKWYYKLLNVKFRLLKVRKKKKLWKIFYTGTIPL